MERRRIAILGLGSRGKNTYGTYLLEMKDRVEVVALADINEERLQLAGEAHGVKKECCFHSAEEFLAQPKMADAVLICTQDRQHVPMAVAAMRIGYDILMEKPVSPVLEDLQEIVRVQKETGRTVVVCHVLRYTPFFQYFKKTIDSGRIGMVTGIDATENVTYWHQAHSFVRGNWRRDDETSPMLMQKCCHDLDYLVWLSGKKCERVSSFGSLMYFRAENAPEGATKRCMDGCKAKAHCIYDAEHIYLNHFETGLLTGHTDWPCNILAENPTEEKIRKAIEEGPYGRCVFFCDNNVVDHQIVNMEMEGGATLHLTMSAFDASHGRTIKVFGTKGEIWGDMQYNRIRVQLFGEKEEWIDVRELAEDFSGHAGGDKVLLTQFLDLLDGKEPDATITTLETSVESHLVVLAAEMSRKSRGNVVAIGPLRG